MINTREESNFNYNSKVNDIIDIRYSNAFSVILSKCDWVSTTSTRMKEDHFGYTLVSFSHLIHIREKLEDNPYVFLS